MTERVNVFAALVEPPVFEPKQRREKPVANEAIEKIAEDNNFPSRQASRNVREPRRKRRVHRTGRNQQLNVKATKETIERFYRMADERNVPLGGMLELALDALDRAGRSNRE